MNYVWLLSSICMTVIASTLLKLGSRTLTFEGSVLAIGISYATSPLILAGFVTYGLAAVIWVYCLAKFDLSYVTFVSSIQYVLLIAVSILVFHEQISMLKWAGCAFIMVGVIFWLRG